MDSKADDQALFFELRRQRGILLLTTPRKGTDKSESRQRMIEVLKKKKNQRLYISDVIQLNQCKVW